MVLIHDDLPDDAESLKALLLAARAGNARLSARNERLDHIISVLRRARFGRSSERITDDQLNLALEDVETAFAVEDAKAEEASDVTRRDAVARRRANRGHLPAHLPREEIVIEPEAKSCPCCGGARQMDLVYGFSLLDLELHGRRHDRHAALEPVLGVELVKVTRGENERGRSDKSHVAEARADGVHAALEGPQFRARTRVAG